MIFVRWALKQLNVSVIPVSGILIGEEVDRVAQKKINNL
tara:strand:- start:400 stop:516 length:117 start_codon:yes stop_codon:yes gene_type:complete